MIDSRKSFSKLKYVYVMFLTSYSGGFGLVEEKEDLVKRLRHVMDVEKGQLETELASKIEELESMKVLYQAFF